MSAKDKLIDKIRDRLRLLENNNFVIVLGQKEWDIINSLDSKVHAAYVDIDALRRTILGHKCKVLPMPTALEVISEDTFKMMMDMHKRDIMDGLSRLNTQFAYL